MDGASEFDHAEPSNSKLSAGIRVDGASECDHAEPVNLKFTAGKAEF